MTAVAFASFAGLLSELAWTRLASVALYAGAITWVVAFSVAALAAGSALAAARPEWRTPRATALWLQAAGIAMAGGLLVTTWLGGQSGLLAVALGVAPGFVMLGGGVAALFAGAGVTVSRVYAADLTAAALAAAGSLVLVPLLSPPGAIGTAAVLAATAGVFAAPAVTRRAGFAALLTLVVALAAAWSLNMDALLAGKPAGGVLQRSGVSVASTWGPLGRSDLMRRADGAEVLYLDGSAGSLLPAAPSRVIWEADPTRFVVRTAQPEGMFIVGAGAGLEVAHGLDAGVGRIVAADVNGAGADLARDRLTGTPQEQVFNSPAVTWLATEARTALALESEPFDLIVLAQSVTRTSEVRGLTLTENTLYTREAMALFFGQLSADGLLSFELYDEATLARALHLAVDALVTQGLARDDAAAFGHLMAFLDASTRPATPLLIASRTPLERSEVVAWARAAEAEGLQLLLLPGLLAPPSLEAVSSGEQSFADLAADRAAEVNLSVPTDDRPFFWSFEPGLPRTLERLLLVLLPLASLASLGLIVPAWRRHGRQAGGLLAAAAALGAAFLGVQLSLVSLAGPWAGQVDVTLAGVLGGMLLGAGVGSGTLRSQARLDVAAWLTAAAAAAGVLTLTWLDPLGVPGELRVAMPVVGAVLVGVMAGRPFPLVLRRLAGISAGSVARAWALSGVGALIAGALALALPHALGLTLTGLVFAGVYALSATVHAGPR